MWYLSWWGITFIILCTLVLLFLLSLLLRNLPIVGSIFNTIVEIGFFVGKCITTILSAITEGINDID